MIVFNAGDIIILADLKENIQKGLDVLDLYSQKRKLTINGDKW